MKTAQSVSPPNKSSFYSVTFLLSALSVVLVFLFVANLFVVRASDVDFSVLQLSSSFLFLLGLCLLFPLWKISRANKQMIEETERQCESFNRMKKEFMANMSHEIRTPLNGIMGMTDLVLNSEISADQRRFLEMSRSSANRLLDVVNEILDFSKIEAGKFEIDSIPFSLVDLVDNSLKMLAVRAHDKGLDLSYSISDDLPDDMIGDPGRLRQVLINLVGNSIKFTPKGGVRVSVSKVDSNAGDGMAEKMMLQFSVEDTGIGVDADKQRSIFQAFEQADGSSARKYGGTGLGLALCSEIVSLMGGKIWLDTAAPDGALFHFTVVLRRPFSAYGFSDQIPASDLHAKKILLVAGNATDRFVLREMMSKMVEHVEMAASIEDAHLLIEQKTYDVVLLDSLPNRQALFELAEKIGAITSITKIIMLTATGQRGDAARCLAAGISSYLLKPVTRVDLFHAVRTVLSQAEQQKMPLVTRHSLRENQHSLHILLAEDEEINRIFAVELIRAEGWRVSTVENGSQLLEAVKNASFDLILMDIQMPEMDGMEAFRQLRLIEKKSGSHTPVIALTAHAMPEDRQRFHNAGMEGFLAKPVTAKILRPEIEKVLGRSLHAKKVTLASTKKSSDFFDYETFLYDNCNGKMELARKLLAHLLNISGPQWLAEAKAAVDAGDEMRLRKVCHSLRGTAATVCAFSFSEAGARLGKLAKEGRMNETPRALDDLYKEFDRISQWARTSDLDLF